MSMLIIASPRASRFKSIGNVSALRYAPINSRPLPLQISPRFLTSLLKPWPQRRYDCHGDYRKETFLEEHIGGPLYAEQGKLPRLPVPTIEETIQRFLPTALPLAETEEDKLELQQACESFPEEARVLQERLLDRQTNEMKDTSWLQLWWNQMGYLQVRDSVVHNVSYFLELKNDLTSNQQQIQRAAAILWATAQFRNQVCSGELPATKVGKQQIPLCSTSFKYMFHACRIPLPLQDSYSIYDPSRTNHVIVARKGHWFAMDFVDGAGEPLSVDHLEQQLEKCIELADAIPATRPKLGLLTSLDRDTWATDRQNLVELGGDKMEEALEILESGAVVINLDDNEPESHQDGTELFLSGGKDAGENRWFDKSVNLIVTVNGKAAMLCEHSMMDGTSLVALAHHLTSTSYEDAAKSASQTTDDPTTTKVIDVFAEAFANLSKENESSIVDSVENARTQFESTVTNQSHSVQEFSAYGSDFIKSAGHSPDAYVQVAMQLAVYRLFGEQAGTYEATQVRQFLHGRTETTRSVSLESEAFVKKMGLAPKKDEGDSAIRKEKLDLLQSATTAHSLYSRDAASGTGVDRHFLGLVSLVGEDESAPSLYSNPVFNASKRWRVSTSNLSHPGVVNWGFGQVVPDGVGIAYSIHNGSCMFNVTALKETNYAPQLSDRIHEALTELQELVELDREASK